MKLLEKDEKGSILLVTMIILITLSVICVLGLKTTYYELTLSGNDRQINKLKVSADSTVAMAVELLEKQPDHVLTGSDWDSQSRPCWFSRGEANQFDMESSSDKYNKINAYTKNTANWKNADNSPSNCSTVVKEADTGQSEQFENNYKRSKFQVIDVEVAPGSSLETGNSYKKLHNLYITGMSEEGKGKSMVQIGYRKRF